MGRTLAILAVLCAAGSIAAGETLVAQFPVERDNANDTGAPLNNSGRLCNVRFGKDHADGTWYGDWSEADLMEIEVLLASPPPAPETAWEVRLGMTGATWEQADPTAVYDFGAFASVNDWYADEAGDNVGPNANAGACDSFADARVPNVPWIDPANPGQPVSFWQLPEMTNSVRFVGFVPATGPADVPTMEAVVDPPVLAALIGDPLVRGLRAHSPQWNNYQIYNRGQWGTSTAAARLMVYAVPEPATMLLIGLGGLGLLLRKRR